MIFKKKKNLIALSFDGQNPDHIINIQIISNQHQPLDFIPPKTCPAQSPPPTAQETNHPLMTPQPGQTLFPLPPPQPNRPLKNPIPRLETRAPRGSAALRYPIQHPTASYTSTLQNAIPMRLQFRKPRCRQFSLLHQICLRLLYQLRLHRLLPRHRS